MGDPVRDQQELSDMILQVFNERFGPLPKKVQNAVHEVNYEVYESLLGYLRRAIPLPLRPFIDRYTSAALQHTICKIRDKYLNHKP